MFRIVALSLLVVAISTLYSRADDPPAKKLTAEERKELDAKWREHSLAGTMAYKSGNVFEAGESFKKALDLARKLYPESEFPDGHPLLATSLDNLGTMLWLRGEAPQAEKIFCLPVNPSIGRRGRSGKTISLPIGSEFQLLATY